MSAIYIEVTAKLGSFRNDITKEMVVLAVRTGVSVRCDINGEIWYAHSDGRLVLAHGGSMNTSISQLS